MATWIRIDEDLPTHPKTTRFKRLLKLETRREAVGMIASLFLFTLGNAWEDGNLEEYGAEGIAEALEWRGDPEELLRALRECGGEKDGAQKPGFLNGWIVHNWVKRAGKLIHDRHYRSRQKEARANGKNVITSECREIWNEFARKHDLEQIESLEIGAGKFMSCTALRSLIEDLKDQPYALGAGDDGWKVTFDWLCVDANQKKVKRKRYKLRGKAAARADAENDDWRERAKAALKNREPAA